jgi:hypothetical protein
MPTNHRAGPDEQDFDRGDVESKETYEVGDRTRVECPRRNVSAFNALDKGCIIVDCGGNIRTGQTDAVADRFDPAPKRPRTFDVSDRFRVQLRKKAANEQSADSFSA